MLRENSTMLKMCQELGFKTISLPDTRPDRSRRSLRSEHPALARKQRATWNPGEKVPRHASKHPFSHAAVSVGSGNNEIRSLDEDTFCQLHGGVPRCFERR